MKDGANLGITGTPGFFVGLFNSKSGEIQGEVLSGAQPYDAFPVSYTHLTLPTNREV